MTEQEMLDKIERLITRAERAEARLCHTVTRQSWLEDAKEVWREIAEEALGREEASKVYFERMDALEDTTADL